MADGDSGRTPAPAEEPGRRELERRAGLWPIGRALTAATVAAVVGLALVMIAVLAALGFPRLEPAKSLPARQLLDVLKFVLGTVAGVGALFALVMAYRRQRLAEEAHRLTEDAHVHNQHDATERRVTELYNAAATQLGSDQAPVRLTALYTLERLANANPDHQQTIVNIICAYLRMPYTPPATTDSADHQRQAARRYHSARHSTHLDQPPAPSRDPHEERQVRLTAQRILHTHLQPSATVHWANIDLDLTGASLLDFNLAFCHLNNAYFREAMFSGDTVFSGAVFSGEAVLGGAVFSGDAEFGGAVFGGMSVFVEARFGGHAGFERAQFDHLSMFNRAEFSKYTEFGEAKFDGSAEFSRAVFSDVAGFGRAVFGGDARFSKAKFDCDARFSRVAFGGDARFDEVRFNGDATFVEAEFGGDARFDEVRFNGDARFSKAKFDGRAVFVGVAFGGGAVFVEAKVGDVVIFRAVEVGGVLDLVSLGVADRSQPHELPSGWQIEPGEGSEGRVVAETAPGA
ncbi:hypothetical protein GCM10009678_05170 [Actinomadura kijaniata]|uniref:Uncharacterized protein YjbI with pentapeptide repeats n=1 Tax=Actinomadura namibiensis TaxID=182080 RepID=A0A7W3LTC6_ACTNM|nr:pentapeptide repeat-containing protein [Actinomadura namibiensis]MBA8953919.1 uncharacterized protein YjbI with pentapeptide repeats [Actinomadura namibiensis]